MCNFFSTASMRPRTLIRGNADGRIFSATFTKASMRPRTLIRGNAACTDGSCRGLFRFNEAADSHPRKRGPSIRAQAQVARRFNEAADSHPRKLRGAIQRRSRRDHASMRPRTLIRGNEEQATEGPEAYFKLQ